jgi:hypothetical protein
MRARVSCAAAGLQHNISLRYANRERDRPHNDAVSGLRCVSLHGDTQAAVTRDEIISSFSSNRLMRRAFRRRGNMDRQQSTSAGEAPGCDLDVLKIPTLKPAFSRPPKHGPSTSARSVQTVRPRPRADKAPPGPRTLTDAEVLKVLQNRRAGVRPAAPEEASDSSDVTLLPPEDTTTRLVLREAVGRNAPVSFAVQLQWSVQPIEVKSVPQHPIFHAYALYAAEGRRADRTWYFLRLGFFSDAVSAKQVAQYLRRDFASAAVVPVSPAERQQVAQKGHCPEAATIARRPA